MSSPLALKIQPLSGIFAPNVIGTKSHQIQLFVVIRRWFFRILKTIRTAEDNKDFIPAFETAEIFQPD